MAIKVTYKASHVPFPIVVQCEEEQRFYTLAGAKELRDKLDKVIKQREKIIEDGGAS